MLIIRNTSWAAIALVRSEQRAALNRNPRVRASYDDALSTLRFALTTRVTFDALSAQATL